MRSSIFQTIICLAILLGGCTEKKLPYYGQHTTKETKRSDGSVQIDTVYKTIPPFTFLNQDSVSTGQSYFDGKIYIADFFFTSCTTICPEMHRNMKGIYDKYKDDNDVLFLSHTIDFKYDKPSALKRYAQKLAVDGKKWQFLYGSKTDVYDLAEKHYLVAVGEDGKAPDGYIHQGYFILVDKTRHVRGYYDGTNAEEVQKLYTDLETLKKEYR